MNMKYLLIMSILAITTSCANQTKTEAVQTPPPAAQVNTTSAKEVTPVNPPKLKSPVMVDAITCALDGDVREIYIESTTPKGCKSWYSNKKVSPAAHSTLSLKYCEAVNANIRRNLEAAGFKCQPLGTSK